MKNFTCTCGQRLFFENARCLNCDRLVGFDPNSLSMRAIEDGEVDASGASVLCKNRTDYDVCNWIRTSPDSSYCFSCDLNQIVPNLLSPDRRRWWKNLEHAKRRLLYSVFSLHLPISNKKHDDSGLAFEFLEDKRSNPSVFEEHVNTGYHDGLITINLAEADDVKREISRQYTGELYRTLLGHFRHESGHHYYWRLINTNDLKNRFRELFGDVTLDYSAALENYYNNKYSMPHNHDFISHYAQAHPLEDWAEVWAHYLHMVDTLETAGAYNMQQGTTHFDEIDDTLRKWSELTIMLNALNRSMGLEDAYPFVLSELTVRKLRFVHDLIYPS